MDKQQGVDNMKAKLEAALANISGTTLAYIAQTTPVGLAAKNKARNIVKHTEASVTLANNLKEMTNLYLNKVKKTAISGDAEEFELSSTWFKHTDTYSIVKHNTKEQYYLYVLYNKCHSSVYEDLDTGTVMSKEEVAELMTPSAAKKLLGEDGVSHNKKNDVKHMAVIRTIAIANLDKVTISGNEIVA